MATTRRDVRHRIRAPAIRGTCVIAREAMSTRRLSYAALLVAAGLSGAYAPHPPNVEVVTLVAFGAGVLMGGAGVAVAALMEAIYALLNPWGPVHPFVFAAQVAGMGIAGLVGALFAAAGGPRWRPAWRVPALAAAGVSITIVFDLLTNTATGLAFGQVRVWLLQGIPWMLGHLTWNAIVFAAVGTPLSGVFAHYRARLSSPA
jgi:hypothetical protein